MTINSFQRVSQATVLLMLILFTSPGFAAWETIASGSRLCGKSGDICLNGNIRFEKNEKLMVVSTRIASAPGEGLITLIFFGKTTLEESVQHSVSHAIKGHKSEIVELKFKSPYNNQTQWWLEDITFQK